MTTAEKLTTLLNKNFLLIANWQGADLQITNLDTEQNVTIQHATGTSHLVPLATVSDIGFASRLVPDRYLPIDEYNADLTSRFGVFCQLTDLTDDTASALLGRAVRLNDLREPDDWKVICAGLIGL